MRRRRVSAHQISEPQSAASSSRIQAVVSPHDKQLPVSAINEGERQDAEPAAQVEVH
jgi:hypothetical protein